MGYSNVILLKPLVYTMLRENQRGQTYTIDIKGYVFILGAAITKSETNIETVGHLEIQIKKIMRLPAP